MGCMIQADVFARVLYVHNSGVRKAHEKTG